MLFWKVSAVSQISLRNCPKKIFGEYFHEASVCCVILMIFVQDFPRDKVDYVGEHFELEAYTSGERLFFVFGDLTSRHDTYPAGRFVYAASPGENGNTILDFNQSYNPPCAFGDFSTCPVASPRNRLPVRVEAGERFVAALHVGSLTND